MKECSSLTCRIAHCFYYHKAVVLLGEKLLELYNCVPPKWTHGPWDLQAAFLPEQSLTIVNSTTKYQICSLAGQGPFMVKKTFNQGVSFTNESDDST